MKDGPDIARVASLLGDPARANMITALMAGEALTAGELAREAGVSAPTASSHLTRLAEGGLVSEHRAGRHRYYALADADVAALVERLISFAARRGHNRVRPGPREPQLRHARVCYDHLAGERGVALFEALVSKELLASTAGELRLTRKGERYLRDFGLDLEALSRARRPLCRPCLDWSERRTHLAGGLGAALLARFSELGWISRATHSRAVTFTPSGNRSFTRLFGPARG